MLVNVFKSKLYLSPLVNRRTEEEVKTTLGVPVTSDIGKYLGVPLITGQIGKKT